MKSCSESNGQEQPESALQILRTIKNLVEIMGPDQVSLYSKDNAILDEM
tara:strand:+ start:572 stop:718 length:147 start_codon:yes stop_codon:yes gene_type:complete